MYSIGVDPGWKNLGVGIVEQQPGNYKSKLVFCKTYNPSASSCPEEFVEQVFDADIVRVIGDYWWGNVKHFSIERYVAYANVKTSETENITSLIGMINFLVYQKSTSRSLRTSSPIDRHQLRAIEWKVSTAQMLAKHTQFRNPSTQLDKKFSIAVAKELINDTDKTKPLFETDHEADAIALACIPFCKEFLLPVPNGGPLGKSTENR